MTGEVTSPMAVREHDYIKNLTILGGSPGSRHWVIANLCPTPEYVCPGYSKNNLLKNQDRFQSKKNRACGGHPPRETLSAEGKHPAADCVGA